MKVMSGFNLKIMVLRVKCILLSVILVFSAAACTDEEWDNISITLGGMDDFRLPPLILPPVPRMLLAFDSARQENDSTLTLWMHCKYDSIMVLCGVGANYWNSDNPDKARTMIEPKSDTIDFRILENFIYAYSFRIDSIESDTEYRLCAFLDHSVKGDTVRVFTSVYGGGCQTLKTR